MLVANQTCSSTQAFFDGVSFPRDLGEVGCWIIPSASSYVKTQGYLCLTSAANGPSFSSKQQVLLAVRGDLEAPLDTCLDAVLLHQLGNQVFAYASA